MATRVSDSAMPSQHPRRRLLAAVVWGAACSALPACGPGTPRGAPPTATQQIAAVQQQAKGRAEAMRARPAAAGSEAALFIESLEPLAKDAKSPFVGLLAAVKEIQSSLGQRPSPAAAKTAADRLEEEAAKLAP